MRWDARLTTTKFIASSGYGGSERLTGTPSSRKAVYKGDAFNPCDFNPLRDAESATFEGDAMIDPSVTGLLCDRGPSTIPRLIVAVIIYSVQRITLRAWTYITQECLKRPLPFRANRYAPPAVAVESFSVRVRASSLHSAPRSILSRAASIVCPYRLRVQAAARVSSPARDVARRFDYFRSAHASPLPLGCASSVPACIANSREASELLSIRDGSYNFASHDLNLVNRLGLRSGLLGALTPRGPFVF